MAVDDARERGCAHVPRDERGQLLQTRRHLYVPDQPVVVDVIRQPNDSGDVPYATEYLFIEEQVGGEWQPSHFFRPFLSDPQRLSPIRRFRADAIVPSLGGGVPYKFYAPEVEKRTQFRLCALLGAPGRATSATFSEFDVLTPAEFEARFGQPPPPVENTGPMS